MIHQIPHIHQYNLINLIRQTHLVHMCRNGDLADQVDEVTLADQVGLADQVDLVHLVILASGSQCCWCYRTTRLTKLSWGGVVAPG